MTATRKSWTVLTVLPAVIAVGAGAAHAAPGQPGLAAPGQGQPGLTTTPTPPRAPSPPSLVDWVPSEPETVLPTPSRPRPHQQQMLIQPPRVDDEQLADPSETPAEVTTPAALRPDTFRFGAVSAGVPDWVDPVMVAKAQKYSNWAEWWIAEAYDRAGFSPADSDRRAASTLVGVSAGATIGALVAAPIPAILGCGVGAAIGAAVGGIGAGIATGGAYAAPGAGIGALAGCGIGFVGAGLTAAAVGAGIGGLTGGLIAGALGGASNVADPGELPALVDAPPPPPPAPAPPTLPDPAVIQDQVIATAQTATAQIEAVSDHVDAIVDQVATVSPAAEQAVTGLRDAVAGMPALDPAQLGDFAALADPFNQLLGAVQTAAAA